MGGLGIRGPKTRWKRKATKRNVSGREFKQKNQTNFRAVRTLRFQVKMGGTRKRDSPIENQREDLDRLSGYRFSTQ